MAEFALDNRLTSEGSGGIRLSGPIVFMMILSGAGVVFIDNGIYLFGCLISLYFIFFISWRTGRPGVIVLCMLTQWLQIAAFPVWMDVSGRDINFLSHHSDAAVLSSCLGLAIIALVIAMGINGLRIPTKLEFYTEARKINEKKILLLYLYSTLSLGSVGAVVGYNSGFFQIIQTLASLKWVFFLVYGYVSWINNKNRFILVLMIVFEFSTSLVSYFSNFKDVILITIILVLTFIRNVTFKQFMYSFLVSATLFFLLLTWTAIKSDYRLFLNKGSGQQEVSVGTGEALSNIGDQLANLKAEKLQVSASAFLYRLQYTYHMALVMDRVPEYMPHEFGKVWWENITYVVTPRILFPDKPIFDATIKTNKYTGMHFSGNQKGASFSLGYFTDSYIDFGFIGMYIPLILLAGFIVIIYRTFYKMKKLNILFRYALINVALYEFFAFESDGLYLFGRLLILYLAFSVLGRTIFPPLQRWLYK